MPSLDLDDPEQSIGLYFELRDGEFIDLEVAAAAAIEWSRALKAAAAALDPAYDYRVTLISAEPGSSKWRAKLEKALDSIEKSKANQSAERFSRGWQRLPLTVRVGIGLAVVIPTTAAPTVEYWLDTASFNDTEIEQIREVVREVIENPSVQAHRRSIYTEVQRDPNISGVGGGQADRADWKPSRLVPADQFAEADGLFELEQDGPPERIIPAELDVVLVAPQLQNARRVWTFRQEGIPGNFRAEMRDKRFLAALERSAVRETLRANIHMRIRLEIRQELIDGEWRVSRRGRSVVEVISPQIGS